MAWAIPFIYALISLRSGRENKSAVLFPIFNVVCVCLAALGIGFCIVTAFSPITYYDSLVYHLALPSYYLLEGRIAPAAFNLYSYFPANTEMLYLFILGILPEPEYVINLLLIFFSVLVAITLHGWAKEEDDGKTGWLAVALWMTMPAVLLLSVGGYIEIPLACYSFLALRAFGKFKDGEHDNRWLIISGLCAGFAFATKYTGAIAPIFIAMALMFAFAKKEITARHLCLFGGMVLIPILPWLVRNAVSIGNPFFPFFYRFFGGNVGWTNESAGAYFQMLTEYGAKSSVFFELLSAPFDMAWNAAKFGGGFDVVGDFGWLLFILMAPMGLWMARKSPQKKWLALYLIFHFFAWFLTKPVLRFLIGALPVAVLFSAIALRPLLTDKNKIVARITAAFAVLITISNIFLYLFICDVFKPFEVTLGQTERELFLEKRLSFYDTFLFLNAAPEENRRVFLIGEQRTYHLRVPYVSASIFAPSPIARICNQSSDLAPLADELNKQHITHIVFHEGEVERLGGLGKFGFSEEGKDVLTRYLSQKCKVVFSKNRVTAYEILPANPT
jgi:hypothetical protein